MTKFGVLTAFSLFVSTILFNNSIPTPSIPCHSSFLCSENNVMSLISHLPSFDGNLSSWILKSTTSSIAYILFATYSNSLYLLVLFHLNGKPVMFFLSPSLLLHLLPLLTIDLYLFSLLPVNFLKITTF